MVPGRVYKKIFSATLPYIRSKVARSRSSAVLLPSWCYSTLRNLPSLKRFWRECIILYLHQNWCLRDVKIGANIYIVNMLIGLAF